MSSGKKPDRGVVMKVLLVTGTFDDKDGKGSFFGETLRKEAVKQGYSVMHYNGGHLTDFNAILADSHNYSVIVWMPHIDNSIDKMLPTIKKIAPKSLLISSKRVIEKSYDEFGVVSRLLKSRSNLGLMITKDEKYEFTVLDPLANRWVNKQDIETAARVLFERVGKIKKYHRISSESVGPRQKIEIEPEFLKVVKEYGERFDDLIKAIHPDRFLGNASTRCMHGFPAVRGEESYLISKRNVDKTIIDDKGFVEVKPTEETVEYYGDNKPSVDSPVQIKLFNYYPEVNYIIHGHVYVKDTLITSRNIPCGYIEEFEEIRKWYPEKQSKNFAINLKGHGCILLAADLDWLKEKKPELVARPFPEDSLW